MDRLLLRKTWRDLRRRRSQIAAVAITVFLGILLFAANNDAARNLGASYEEMYDQLRFGDVWATGGPTDDIVAALVADADVSGLERRTRFDASLRIADRELRGTVIGMSGSGPPAANQLMVLHGTDVYEQPGRDVAVVEQHGWDEFDLAVGDTVAILGDEGWRELEVAGGAASAEYVWLAPSRQQLFTVPDEFAVLFVPEAVARELAPDAPTQVVATVFGHEPEAAERLAERVGELGAADVYTRAEQASNEALQADVTGFEQMSFMFPMLFLTVAGMAAFVLLSRLVRTERSQIGMMVANGVDARTIRWHYTSHALVAVFLGAVPGLILGALLGRWVTGLYTDFLGIPVTVVRFSPATIAWSLGFALAVALLAGGLPARAAARIQPAEAMRPPIPRMVSKRSWVERWWPGELPRWLRMVVRNITRSRRRFLSTALGVVLAMVLVIVSLGLSDSVAAMVDRAFDEVDRRDLTVTFDGEVTETELARLVDRDDVSAAERFAEVPVLVSAGEATADQLLQVFEPTTSMHGFESSLPESGLVLGSSARSVLDASVGDRVTLTVPAAGLAFDTVVAGFADEPIPSISYVSVAQWEAAGATIDSAVVSLVDRDAHREFRDALQAEPGVVAVVDQQANREVVHELLGLTDLFVGLMIAFALVMAVALVYNMVSVSLAERTGEVATLQANGVGRRLIRRTVTVENLLTLFAGVVPGTVLGWLVAREFLGQFDTESFSFELALQGRSIALAIGLVVVAALLAQWPGMRALDRLDLATVLGERSQ